LPHPQTVCVAAFKNWKEEFDTHHEAEVRQWKAMVTVMARHVKKSFAGMTFQDTQEHSCKIWQRMVSTTKVLELHGNVYDFGQGRR